MVILNLWLSKGVLIVWWFFRYLIEHLSKKHIDFSIVINQIFELLNHRMQWFLRLDGAVDFFDKRLHPFVQNCLVRWKPFTNAVRDSFDCLLLLQISLRLFLSILEVFS